MYPHKVLTPFICILFCTAFLASCTKNDPLCDCFKSTGSDISETRPAGHFTQIQLENKVDLVLTQDTVERISVTGGKNLIDEVETSISGGCLYIRNHSTCNFMRGFTRRMTVYVSVHHLNTLNYEGAGAVTTTNTLRDSVIDIEALDGSGSVTLDLNEQVIHANLHTGPSLITLTGTAPLIYMFSGGNGVIHADNIACPQIYLTQEGTGDLYIATMPGFASSLLVGQITAIGNVYCKGRPANLQQTRTGTGQLIFF